MDTELRCNRLSCRRVLTDKAVVTTCRCTKSSQVSVTEGETDTGSHIFDIDCANELFGASQLCPACETSLTELDDVVICALHPTNDYKTSVLAGLSPSVILDICGRAIAFWQYQVHQENSFQQTVVRNVNDRNAQLQKQLDSIIREANNEITLLTNKVSALERDLELERRRNMELQETSRSKDKEYQKLKAQFDQVKRKALLGASIQDAPESVPLARASLLQGANRQYGKDRAMRQGTTAHAGFGGGSPGFMENVLKEMEANGIQRTPLRTNTLGIPKTRTQVASWRKRPRNNQAVNNIGVSDLSDSAHEVEGLLMSHHQPYRADQRRPLKPNKSTFRGTSGRRS